MPTSSVNPNKALIFYPRAMERQLEIMKSMGVNAIRNSHNTAAPEVLELCDRMGLLLFNEVFDKYDAKAGILEDTDFEAFAQRNIRNFVVRDRNHPSVFLWSVGNEIADVQNNENNGFQRGQKLRTTISCGNKRSPTLRANLSGRDSTTWASPRESDGYYSVWFFKRKDKFRGYGKGA